MITGRGGSSSSRGRIRPPRRQAIQSGGKNEFEQCWDKLREAQRNIHNQNAGDLSFEQLYRYSYKIVLMRSGNLLYDRVKEFEEDWFAEKVMPQILALITKNLVSITLDGTPGTSVVERRALGEKFLKGVRTSWEDHSRAMNMVADILMYMDRGVGHDHLRPSIYTVTIGLFRDHILRRNLEAIGSSHAVFDILNATVIDQIDMEREGDVIDKALLRSCTSMLEGLFETDAEIEHERLYLTTFEPHFIRTSHDFYRAECEKLLREADAGAWLRQTQRRLAEETMRCQTTISPSSERAIVSVIDEELITKHLDEFLQLEGSGIRAMIDNDRIEDLRILYSLVSRVDDKVPSLRNALANRVEDLGNEIEQNLNNTDFSIAQGPPATDDNTGDGEKSKPKTLNAAGQLTAAAIKWVDDVLRLKDRFDRLWVECFDRKAIIETALTRSFSGFINRFDRAAEFVSLFIDENLKRGLKGKTEAEVDGVLDKAITLLKHLNEKDKFESYYQKHLARRLLHGKSESQDIEQEMISRMKRELGNNFTQKFEGMFRDMNTSRETTEQYRKYIRDLGEPDDKRIDLNISVLAGNNWPKEIMGRSSGLSVESKLKATYPPEIQSLQNSFFEFYTKNRNGRVLTWVGSAGTADLKCTIPKIPGKTAGPLSRDRRYEINVSTHGMIVLMLFNNTKDDEWLSFEDIQATTNIPQPDLVNVLTSLSVIKQYRILVKDPQTKSAARAGDRFTFNREFVSKTIKIKIPSVNAASRVENDEERKETDEKNLETRKHVADSVIVRIMKQRKELSHTQLVNEVIQVLSGRFKPEMSLIKGQIESLISREYLERDELPDGSPADTYKYVA
ncbi:putative cullin 3 [Rosellinia necatrix]|uniref:Putative cullin 3 n=1 Tax=Rosellinia necatrix TaxID=77044 RepID=A0A1W2TTW9_ROSNE|nr:putative cullin 3 [Rosellinia necatrix]